MTMDWWRQIDDRRFMTSLYSEIGKYLSNKTNPRVLDVGVETYNSVCKTLLNNPGIQYWQLDPKKEYSFNDGQLMCTMQQCLKKYPDHKSSYDVILDFGVLGWPGLKFSQDDIVQYIENVIGLLKDGGLYVLKIDGIPYRSMDRKYQVNFDEHIYPYLHGVSVMGYNEQEVVHGRENDWEFWFLQKR